jgi:DnaJ domain
MDLKLYACCKLFTLTGEVTVKKINASYKKLALLNHPDKHPELGQEKMKMVNVARDILVSKIGIISPYTVAVHERMATVVSDNERLARKKIDREKRRIAKQMRRKR